MSNFKNVSLELGGKSPLVIFQDADLEKAAAAAAAASITLNSGQICVASSRVYVHASISEKLMKIFKNEIISLTTKPTTSNKPLAQEAKRGPMADKQQFDKVMKFLSDSKSLGHNRLLGGGRDGEVGYFIQPTILYYPGDESAVMKEEIFGPIVCLSTFEFEEHVLR